MAKRKFLFIAIAPLLLLLGMMLSFRILSQLPASEPEPIPIGRGTLPPATTMTPANATTQKALASAVQGQLTAIRNGDFAAALTFSTPRFREMSSPKRFQEMIENGYKEMMESKKEVLQIGQVAENNANLRVVVTTMDNVRMGYIYDLVREEDKWYVQGCSRGFPMGSVSESIEGGRPSPPGMKSSLPVAPKL